MKIAQKLLLIILASSFIPLSIANFFAFIATQNALRNQIQAELNNTEIHQFERLTTHIDQVNAKLNNIAFKARTRLLLDQYNNTPSLALQQELNLALVELIENEPTFKRIHLLSSAGKIVASTDPAFIGLNYDKTEVFITGSKGQTSSIFFRNSTGDFRQYLASPVEVNNSMIGVVVIEALANQFLLVTGDYSELSLTGESYIVRKTANGTQEYLTPLRFKPDAALTKVDKPITTSSDYRNRSVIIAKHEMQNGNWTLITKIDQEEVLAPINQLRTTLIIILLISFIAVIFIALYLARSFSNPIITLTKKTRLIIKGDLNQTIDTRSTDEIGELGTAFNQMIGNIKQKIQQLHDAQIKLEASINSLSVGYIMVDREFNIVTINHTAQQTFCASSSSPFTLVTECTLNHIQIELKEVVDLHGVIEQCFNEKRALMVREISFKHKTFKIIVTPIITIGVIGAVVLIDDITEAKILERSRDEFFSIASHELRTPLTAIRGNTSMIQEFFGDKMKDSADFSDMIKDIHESSVRLIAIVNDFLDTSRLEQGKMDFKKELVNLPDLINSVMKEYQVTVANQKLFLTFQQNLTTSLPQVVADFNKTKQIVINLISNALKFTEQGGITITTEVNPSFVKILIVDTGRGISPENQLLLFRKFQQANSSILTRDTTKGTGLGLYISKLLVEGMGGTIKLEDSIEGKGTTFSFTLPLATTISPQNVV